MEFARMRIYNENGPTEITRRGFCRKTLDYADRRGQKNMNIGEKQIVMDLCRFLDPNRARLLRNMEKCGDMSDVLGLLLYNRVGGIAYNTLRECELLGKVNREVRNTLQTMYNAAIIQQESYAKAAELLASVLRNIEVPYAVLKGIVLMQTYPRGCRTSNDVDILTAPEHVSAVAERLKAAGFRQGYIRNNRFVPATRKEIISSRMNRGETVPYILEADYPFMKFLEVDINFSLDYKPTDGESVRGMLKDGCQLKNGLRTLNPACFILHLCAHLYKEATTMSWIQMGRDLSLYKFVDLYLLLSHAEPDLCEQLLKTAESLDLTAACAYALAGTIQLFDMRNAALLRLSERLCRMHENILDVVIDPAGGKRYVYTIDFMQRIFSSHRQKYLKEVGDLGSSAYV